MCEEKSAIPKPQKWNKKSKQRGAHPNHPKPKTTLLEARRTSSYRCFPYWACLVVPFGLITQMVLLGGSSICPGSPWTFHEVLSSPSFFLLFSFLGKFLLWEFFCLFPNFIYFILIGSCVEETYLFSSPAFDLFSSWDLATHGHLVES